MIPAALDEEFARKEGLRLAIRQARRWMRLAVLHTSPIGKADSFRRAEWWFRHALVHYMGDDEEILAERVPARREPDTQAGGIPEQCAQGTEREADASGSALPADAPASPPDHEAPHAHDPGAAEGRLADLVRGISLYRAWFSAHSKGPFSADVAAARLEVEAWGRESGKTFR